MAEASFSWNFDAGTLHMDSVVNSVQETVQGRPGYGLPLAGCLPGSDELVVDSDQRAPAQVGSESDKRLRDISDKVLIFASTFHAILKPGFHYPS